MGQQFGIGLLPDQPISLNEAVNGAQYVGIVGQPLALRPCLLSLPNLLLAILLGLLFVGKGLIPPSVLDDLVRHAGDQVSKRVAPGCRLISVYFGLGIRDNAPKIVVGIVRGTVALPRCL